MKNENKNDIVNDDDLIDMIENSQNDINLKITMECVYYIKFKRWVPIQIITTNVLHVVNIDILPMIDQTL